MLNKRSQKRLHVTWVPTCNTKEQLYTHLMRSHLFFSFKIALDVHFNLISPRHKIHRGKRQELKQKKKKSNHYWEHAAAAAAAAAKLLQSCPTLCNPIDGSPPGSPVPGILQAKTLEWVAISFSNAWNWKVKVKSLSRFWLLATPWTADYQASPSMGFSRQEYCSGLPLSSPTESIL